MTPMLALPIILGAAASVFAAWIPARFVGAFAGSAAAAAFAIYLQMLPLVSMDSTMTAAFWAVPSLGIAGGLRLDGLSLVFALLISGIGALIFLYAGRYLHGHAQLNRLVVLLLLFMTAMLGAVTADDVIVLFIFWEATSLASFFLVGFDHERSGARKAALQALLVTGGGGLALLAGAILVAMAAGTTSLSGIIAAADKVTAGPLATPAMLLIILGCFAKSAQVPFHFWLPNAMAAPTPVSAYLHSATMVKLGVYLLARLNPVYQDLPLWEGLLTWFGLATAATGALLALRETDLKRVLAYTTVTALGTLVLLIGIAPDLSATAAMTFLIVHAFYKAALFLVAGIVDHETGTRDASALGGLSRAMPLTALAAGLAALSMAGLPPFVGFVAKELVYVAKLEATSLAVVLIAVGFLVNAATVAIAGVLSLRLFFGARRPTPQTPHDPPWGMLAGPFILALLGLVAGAVPRLMGETLIDPAVVAMLGRPFEADLKLWHGFNAVLALSAATVATGGALYFLWEHLVPKLRAAAIFDRHAPSRAYDRLLAGLIAMADRSTRKIQHGSLRGYLQSLFAVAAAGVLLTLVLRNGFAWPGIDPATVDVRALAFVGIAIGALATALAPTVFAAVVAAGLVGFATALVFLFFGAPDVAFTQFAVETLLVALLATAFIRLPIRHRDVRTGRERGADAVIALGAGTAVAAALLAVLAAPFDTRLSDWFGRESASAAHGHNVVNVILVDFRALDTLGEITVLAIAAFAIVALLRPSRRRTLS